MSRWLASIALLAVVTGTTVAAEGWLQINAAAGTRVLVDGEFVGTTIPLPVPAPVAEEETEAMLTEELGAFEPVEAPAPLPEANEDPLGGDWVEPAPDGGAGEEEAALPPEPPAYLVVGPLAQGPHRVRTELVGRPAREQEVAVEARMVTLIVVPAEGVEMEIVEDGPEVELPAAEETGVLEIVSLPIESFVQLGDLEPALKAKPLWRAEAVPVGEVTVTVMSLDGIAVNQTVTVAAGKQVRLLADLQAGIMRDLSAEGLTATWLATQAGEAVVLPTGDKLLWHEDEFWLAEHEANAAAFATYLQEVGDENTAPVADGACRMVSREEVARYCEWLTEKSRTAGAIPPGWALQLPTREQWLAAAMIEDGGWQNLFGGVAEWTAADADGLAVILGGSDGDASPLARGTAGTPGRRARGGDKLQDVGFRIILAPTTSEFQPYGE